MLFRTHAKLNLYLEVIGRRDDGFHEIETVFHGIDLADTLEVEAAPEGDPIIELTGARMPEALGDPQRNLVTKAADLLSERSGRSGVRFKLDKAIPVAAGLGGGSSNAAGALVGLDRLWELGLDGPGFRDAALALGSDVPYFLHGGTALGTGRGEVLRALPSPNDLWFVLGVSEEALPTAKVYDAWRPPRRPEASSSALVAALARGDAQDVAPLLYNALEAPAFSLRPELSLGKEALQRAGALGVCLSGSGPTLFALARDRPHANEVAAAVHGRFDRVIVTCSHEGGVEPVGSFS